MMKIVQFLENISRTKYIKYFLVASYVEQKLPNKNIAVGTYTEIDLIKEPFNLKDYIAIYREMDEPSKGPTTKHLILYDIEKHIKSIDFDVLKEKTLKFFT
jgi:hypothetical protein